MEAESRVARLILGQARSWLARTCNALGSSGLLLLLASCSDGLDLSTGLTQTASMTWTTETRRDVSALAPIRALVLRHAPFKQVSSSTGDPNPQIGKAPGSACEAIRFLTVLIRSDPADTAALAKAEALADWVIGLQEMREARPSYGGVPSTPDLPAPANRYFYTIDAAFCGGAMFALHDLTKTDRFLRSGIAFADFLVRMQSAPSRPYARPAGAPDGFCELIVDTGEAPTWNCDRHVKNLAALPVLRRATVLSGDTRYHAAARSARAFLVDGLAGAWEHADAPSLAGCTGPVCQGIWRRVPGPQGQPDTFVYGDTLAYALRGLLEYEGPSATVRGLYEMFAGYSGKDPKTRSYDGRIAFAGYMHPASKSPDPFSAYYDLVTLGILHGVRRAVRPDHFAVADNVLRQQLASAAQLSWRMDFDLSVPTSAYIDLTTLANLGEALLAEPAQP